MLKDSDTTATNQPVRDENMGNVVEISGVEIDKNLYDSIVNEDSEPKEEVLEHDNTEAKEPEQPSNNESPYQGKTNEELVKMLNDSQAYINKLKSERDKKPTVSVMEQLTESKTNISSKLKRLEETLEEKYTWADKDTDEYIALEKEISKAKMQLAETNEKLSVARIEDQINKAMFRNYNQDFLRKEKERVFKEINYKLSDEIWGNIEKLAQEFAGTGEKVTSEDVEAAVIKNLGAETYRKIIAAKSAEKTRESIATAAGKTVTHAIPNAESKSTGKLTEAQTIKLIDKLYTTDRKKYEEFKRNLFGIE